MESTPVDRQPLLGHAEQGTKLTDCQLEELRKSVLWKKKQRGLPAGGSPGSNGATGSDEHSEQYAAGDDRPDV